MVPRAQAAPVLGYAPWSPGDNQAGLVFERLTVLQVFWDIYEGRVHCDAGTRQQPRQTVQHSHAGSLRESIPAAQPGDVLHLETFRPRLGQRPAPGQVAAGKAAVAPVPPW